MGEPVKPTLDKVTLDHVRELRSAAEESTCIRSNSTFDPTYRCAGCSAYSYDPDTIHHRNKDSCHLLAALKAIETFLRIEDQLYAEAEEDMS